jgi:hypothetical protein
MDIGTAITVLGSVVGLAGISLQIKDWFFGSLSNPTEVTAITGALQNIPSNAESNEVLEALEPIFMAKGGEVLLSAGDNSGGDLHIKNTLVEGGSGPGGGGGVKIAGGNGGPLGKGGVTKISSSVIKGGNTK